MATSDLLSELKKLTNLSDSKLAQLLETSLVSISQWQRGITLPTPSQTRRIGDLYNRLLLGRGSADFLPDAFQSRGIRRRTPGQGVLGKRLPSVKFSDSTRGRLIDRLSKDGVFDGDGELAIKRLLNAHPTASPTTSTPFAGSVSAGKNTYTYDAHTYHTKVPPQGISELLKYYLPKGGLVLDPFAGSGMTGVAALVSEHDCILNELSPAACFISSRFITSVSPDEFEATVEAVLNRLASLRRKLYTTECRECGRQTELLYVVWSYNVTCRNCKREFLLWDHCKKFGKTVREHKILGEFPCPFCGRVQRKSTLQRTTVAPVLVGYKCCGSRQQERTHPPTAMDRQRIADLEISAPLAEGFHPSIALPDGVNLRQPAKHGLDRIEKFYTRRNLSALSHIWQTIHQIEEPQLSGQLAFVFTSLYQRVTKLSEFRFWGGSGNAARFNVPFIFNEANVFVTFERKARTILDHLESTTPKYKGRAVVINGSATSMDRIPDGSIDLIFTDPPFGANINYSEMNLLWESWLGRYTRTENEAIVNRVQGKDVGRYRELMTQSLAESYRVLRPGHWMLLVFMNSSSTVWAALKSAIRTAGFDVVRIDAFDKQHGTFKQFVSENTAGMDLVLQCLKPQSQTVPARSALPACQNVLSFLETRPSVVPTNVFLHVNRGEEIDYRRLYSEWLAGSFAGEQDFLDFSAFRKIVQQWLDGKSS